MVAINSSSRSTHLVHPTPQGKLYHRSFLIEKEECITYLIHETGKCQSWGANPSTLVPKSLFTGIRLGLYKFSVVMLVVLC